MAQATAAPRRRRWLLPLAVAGALLAGAVLETTTIVLTGHYRSAPEFSVDLYLQPDIADEERSALQAALLGALGTLGTPVDFDHETREEAYQNFRELFKDDPDLLAQIKPTELPESFRASVTVYEFDCELLRPVTTMAGASTVIVREQPAGIYGSLTIHCDFAG